MTDEEERELRQFRLLGSILGSFKTDDHRRRDVVSERPKPATTTTTPTTPTTSRPFATTTMMTAIQEEEEEEEEKEEEPAAGAVVEEDVRTTEVIKSCRVARPSTVSLFSHLVVVVLSLSARRTF